MDMTMSAMASQPLRAFKSFCSCRPPAARRISLDDHLSDVTLVADNHFVRCHQAVLSSFSNILMERLKEFTDDASPVLYFTDVSWPDLHYLLIVVYEGRVELPQSHVAAFRSLAESLDIQVTEEKTRETQATQTDPVEIREISDVTTLPDLPVPCPVTLPPHPEHGSLIPLPPPTSVPLTMSSIMNRNAGLTYPGNQPRVHPLTSLPVPQLVRPHFVRVAGGPVGSPFVHLHSSQRFSHSAVQDPGYLVSSTKMEKVSLILY